METTILIADDSEFMRGLLREILEDDYEIVGEAGTGVEAVQLYIEYIPDLVLMDIIMPLKNGIEATTEIKDEDSNAKVIMCTSVGQEERMEAAMNAGADGYIKKPFQKSQIVDTIRDIVPAEA